jgi:tRNA dimethylallyltransferase
MKPIKQSPDSNPMICILGATATGKTRLAVALANSFGGEIISADSRQVYRGLDIGSGKDLDEYGSTPHHLIDIVDPGHEFNVFEFIVSYNDALEKIQTKGNLPFLVGGTGMYLDAVLSTYQLTVRNAEHAEALQQLSDHELEDKLRELIPDQHNTTDTETRSRMISAIEIALAKQAGEPVIQANTTETLILGIAMPREKIREGITRRLKQRSSEGLIEEVEHLHANGVSWEQLYFYGLEYRFIAQYLQGQLNYNDMFQKLNSAIHQFAKQQEKWFRNIEKKGHKIHWINASADIEALATETIKDFLPSQ